MKHLELIALALWPYVLPKEINLIIVIIFTCEVLAKILLFGFRHFFCGNEQWSVAESREGRGDFRDCWGKIPAGAAAKSLKKSTVFVLDLLTFSKQNSTFRGSPLDAVMMMMMVVVMVMVMPLPYLPLSVSASLSAAEVEYI